MCVVCGVLCGGCDLVPWCGGVWCVWCGVVCVCVCVCVCLCVCVCVFELIKKKCLEGITFLGIFLTFFPLNSKIGVSF